MPPCTTLIPLARHVIEAAQQEEATCDGTPTIVGVSEVGKRGHVIKVSGRVDRVNSIENWSYCTRPSIALLQSGYSPHTRRVSEKNGAIVFSNSFLIRAQVPGSDKKSPPTVPLFKGICKNIRFQRGYRSKTESRLRLNLWLRWEEIDRQGGCPGKNKRKKRVSYH